MPDEARNSNYVFKYKGISIRVSDYKWTVLLSLHHKEFERLVGIAIDRSQYIEDFNLLNINFVTSGSSTFFIHNDYLDTININEEHFLSKHARSSHAKICEDIVNSFVHELTHLWHFRLTNIHKMARRKTDHLIKKLYRMNSHDSVKKSCEKLRLNMMNRMSLLSIEGLAMYVGQQIKGKNEILKHNSKAGASEIRIRDFNACWSTIKKEKKYAWLSNIDLIFNSYVIGEYMVLELISSKKYTLDDVAQLTLVGFIHEYEKLMHKKNLKPLITYSSGKGLFDYKTFLNELNILYEHMD